MIAGQVSAYTSQHPVKTHHSANAGQIARHPNTPKHANERACGVKNLGDPGPFNQNRTLIAKCIKRLDQSKLFGQGHVERYLNKLNRYGCRANTIRINFKVFYQFISYLKSYGRTCLETTVRDDIGGFVEYGQDRGLAATTVAAQLRCLYAFLRYLAQRDLVHPDLLKNKFKIKLPETLPRAIDPEDIKKLVSVIHHVRNKAMVLMLLRTGVRIGELLNLKIDDIYLKEKRIDIFEARKTRTGRVVYLSDDAFWALKAWLRARCSGKTNLFYSQGRSAMSYEAARIMFIKYLDKASLSHKDYKLHCLRHTFASELLNAGMRLECVQQLLGHRNIEQTRRYARLTDNTRKEEYFRAMEIIEKGGINGHYRIDSTLSPAPEA